MQFRIGDRDPVSGLYAVIWPDGSSTLNGIKIFNAAHHAGDVVVATRRSDGMMILDGAKAVEVNAPQEIRMRGLDDRPVGYLNGQVFNNEDEILPVVSIDFVPGSPTSLREDTGSFLIRISLNTKQRKDFQISFAVSGTADYLLDYTISTNPLTSVIINAGQEYVDISIAPVVNFLHVVSKTVTLTLTGSSGVRVGANRTVTMTIVPRRFHYQIYTRTIQTDTTFPVGTTAVSTVVPSSLVWALFAEVDEPETVNSFVDYDAAWNLALASVVPPFNPLAITSTIYGTNRNAFGGYQTERTPPDLNTFNASISLPYGAVCNFSGGDNYENWIAVGYGLSEAVDIADAYGLQFNVWITQPYTNLDFQAYGLNEYL